MNDRDAQPRGPAARFVARDERERLFVALAALVTRCGPENVTPAAIAGAAGLPYAAFERSFASVEECMLAAYEATADQAYAAVAAAYRRTTGGWPDSVHAGLAQLLAFLARSPRLTRLCTVEALHVGAAALDRRDRSVERFVGVLEAEYRSNVDPEPPSVAAEAIGGGVFELIRGHALEERVEQLPAALPAATVIVLAPFVGHAEAERLAERPAPVPAGGG